MRIDQLSGQQIAEPASHLAQLGKGFHVVLQDQQLDVLGRLTPTTQDNQRQRTTNQQVHQRKDHETVFQPTI